MSEEVIKSKTNCPTCGSEVKVAGETTHYYVPKQKLLRTTTLEEDSFSYEMAKRLFKKKIGRTPRITQGDEGDELAVASMQVGLIEGTKMQSMKSHSNEEVLRIIRLVFQRQRVFFGDGKIREMFKEFEK